VTSGVSPRLGLVEQLVDGRGDPIGVGQLLLDPGGVARLLASRAGIVCLTPCVGDLLRVPVVGHQAMLRRHPRILGLSIRSALVAQGIERRTPKPGVAGSNPAGGTRC
jgi:hypothetical protein